MNRILVTGASGFVGQRLLSRLLEAGHAVRATARRMPENTITGIGEWIQADLTDRQPRLRDLVKDCRAVIHLAGLAHAPGADPAACDRANRQVTLNLAQAAAAAGVERFVFLSTIKVHGEGWEGDAERAYACSDTPAPEDAYAQSKWAAEQGLQEVCRGSAAMDFTVVRVPLIYGPGVSANFLALLKLVNTGLPLPLAGIANRRSLIYVDNLCDLLARVVDAPVAAGRTYLAADTTLSTPELIDCIARALGREPVLFALRRSWLKMAAVCLGRRAVLDRLTQSLVVDDSGMRLDLDWTPPVALETAMQMTADWYLRMRRKGGGVRSRERLWSG